MLFHTIANRRVARDPQTQRLRRIMLALLACLALLFALVAVAARRDRPAGLTARRPLGATSRRSDFPCRPASAADGCVA